MADWTINNRIIVNKKFQVGQGPSLDVVRGVFESIEKLKQPEDVYASSNTVMVEFKDGIMRGHLGGKMYRFTRVGARTLASRVLPSRALGTLKSLAEIDEKSEFLATAVWAKFATARRDDESLVRIANVGAVRAGKTHKVRAIRSVHSANYAPYSHVEFLQAISDHAEMFKENKALQFIMTDEVMRVRMEGEGTKGLIPVVDIWNSEVGQRSVVLHSGLYNERTESFVGHYSRVGARSWIHSGNPDRIARNVEDSLKHLFSEGNRVREAYEAAMNRAIDDASDWMEELLENRKIASAHIEVAKSHLSSPRVHRSNGDVTVAGVVDAISLTGAGIEDPEFAYEVERAAGMALKRGLDDTRSSKAAA